MQNKKILFLINGLGYGGAETQLVRLSEALVIKGFDLVLITLTDTLCLSKKLHPKIKHYNIQLKGVSGLKAIKKVLKVVKHEKPKVIHSHLFQANIISRIVKFFNSKVRVINTTHCVYDQENILNLSPYLIYRITKRWVDFHTAVSKESLKLLRDRKSIENFKSSEMCNGLFVDQYQHSSTKNGIFKWLSVGRLIPVKNYELLISACELLVKDSVKFKLDIIGEGFLNQNLANLIKDKKLEDNVSLVGLSENIPNILKDYNAFVISSNSEGLPMVLLEAMSAKLPIVSTNVGGISEVIKGSKGGLIVEPSNKIELASAMKNLMNLSDVNMREMGNNNYIYVKDKFDIDQISNQWITIYNK